MTLNYRTIQEYVQSKFADCINKIANVKSHDEKAKEFLSKDEPKNIFVNQVSCMPKEEAKINNTELTSSPKTQAEEKNKVVEELNKDFNGIVIFDFISSKTASTIIGRNKFQAKKKKSRRNKRRFN